MRPIMVGSQLTTPGLVFNFSFESVKFNCFCESRTERGVEWEENQSNPQSDQGSIDERIRRRFDETRGSPARQRKRSPRVL